MGWDAGWASWRRWRLSQRTWDTAMQEGRERLVMLGAAAATAKSLQSCPTLCDPMGKSTGVGCHLLHESEK